ncbi:3'-5' exonuclease [Plantibacter sp. Mn2098]|uniref:3'-5' exonuclease n=1 Tax=Plantibacter sp. Mn2098 TaxID=3395266 RepID=UPI003BCA0A9A
MNIETTLPTWTNRLAVFDLETTGIDVESSRIVTAFVGVLGAGGEVVEQWSWMADPGIDIPERATEVHGITTEIARRDGRSAQEVVGEIVATLRLLLDAGTPVVAYNAPYDFSLLHHEAVRHGIESIAEPSPVIDPLIIDKQLDRYRKGKRTLNLVSEFYGVPLDGAHDAGVDAIAAGRIAQAIARIHTEHLPFEAADLHELQIGWAAEQAKDFESYMRRVRDPEFTAETGWPIR